MHITQTIGTTASTGFWSPQIISAVINATVSIVTLVVVATIAYRQWRTAHEKLSLDLFDRRLNAFTDALDAIEMKARSIEKSEPFRHHLDGVPGDIEEKLTNSATVLKFLFGDEVITTFRYILKSLDELSGIKSGPSFSDTQVDWIEARQNFTALFETFVSQGDRYMMMGHVAVSRPVARLRWPWSALR